MVEAIGGSDIIGRFESAKSSESREKAPALVFMNTSGPNPDEVAPAAAHEATSSTDTADLVHRLHDPRTRRAARLALLRAKAVEPLLGCLDSTNESVVWAAVVSLGQLRATEAIQPLLRLLEEEKLTLDVCEALERITGRDGGTSPARWRQLLGGLATAGAAPAAGPAGQSGSPGSAEAIHRAAELIGAELSGKDNRYRFSLPLPEGRQQRVALYLGKEDSEGDALVVIYSECGPASERHYETVLRKNLRIPSGAFAIRDIDGKPHFVMVDTVLAVTATASMLAKKIEHIASRADLVEQALGQEDRF